MRIVGGRFRGTALAGLGKGDTAAHLRPTPDRVRESLFNLLMHSFGDPVTDARVLDLFAGTGALGLEALSRGAAHVTFVDQGRTAQTLIAANIDKTRSDAETRLIRRDALKLGPADEAPATLVFLDPPYGKSLGPRSLTAAAQSGWIAPGALIVSEDEADTPAPDGFEHIETRRYGTTALTFLEKTP